MSRLIVDAGQTFSPLLVGSRQTNRPQPRRPRWRHSSGLSHSETINQIQLLDKSTALFLACIEFTDKLGVELTCNTQR